MINVIKASVAALTCLLLCAPVRGQAVIPGTYRFSVCEPACTPTSRPIATGFLVLFSDSAALAEATRAHHVTLGNRIFRFSQYMIAGNACFKVDARVSSVNDREFYFGIIPASITQWVTKQDSVLVPVYTSPDASYIVTWPATRTTGDTITAVGMQNDCCMSGRGPLGQIVAIRVSDPDVRSCV
jgi:hypothetical protein